MGGWNMEDDGVFRFLNFNILNFPFFFFFFSF